MLHKSSGNNNTPPGPPQLVDMDAKELVFLINRQKIPKNLVQIIVVECRIILQDIPPSSVVHSLTFVWLSCKERGRDQEINI